MSEQPGAINVDVESLAELGQRLLDEATLMKQRSEAVVTTMNENPTNFVGGGMVEGLTFQSVHDLAQAGLAFFLGDVVNGLETLGNAALEISATYGESDAVSATTVRELLPHESGSTGTQPV